MLGLNTGLLVGSFYSSLVRVALQLMPPSASASAASFDGARPHVSYDKTLWCSDWECITRMPKPCCSALPSGRMPFTKEGRAELMAPMTRKCRGIIGRHSLKLCE